MCEEKFQKGNISITFGDIDCADNRHRVCRLFDLHQLPGTELMPVAGETRRAAGRARNPYTTPGGRTRWCNLERNLSRCETRGECR